jgi:hypothetical protein
LPNNCPVICAHRHFHHSHTSGKIPPLKGV